MPTPFYRSTVARRFLSEQDALGLSWLDEDEKPDAEAPGGEWPLHKYNQYYLQLPPSESNVVYGRVCMLCSLRCNAGFVCPR
jgi:hypothetical protein